MRARTLKFVQTIFSLQPAPFCAHQGGLSVDWLKAEGSLHKLRCREGAYSGLVFLHRVERDVLKTSPPYAHTLPCRFITMPCIFYTVLGCESKKVYVSHLPEQPTFVDNTPHILKVFIYLCKTKAQLEEGPLHTFSSVCLKRSRHESRGHNQKNRQSKPHRLDTHHPSSLI